MNMPPSWRRMAWGAFALVVGCLGWTAQAVATTQRYVALSQGHEAGALEIADDPWTDAQGQTGRQWSVRYRYRDNGRGPDVQEVLRIDASHRLQWHSVNGNSEFGAPVQELFSRKGTLAQWEASGERGQSQLGQEELAFYSHLHGGPAGRALMVETAARLGLDNLPVLPRGAINISVLARLQWASGDGAATVAVALLSLRGHDVYPEYLWVHDDGSQRLFAQVEPGWTLIEQGWQAAAATLLARQQEVRQAQLRELMSSIRQPLPGKTLIRGARWFDAPAALMREPEDVLIEGGRIIARGATATAHSDITNTIDAPGSCLLPGLWDMHTHLSDEQLPLHLAAGVTTVRDLGNDNDYLQSLQQRLKSGDWLGPRVLANGFIEGESPFASRGGFVVNSLDEALQAVDWYAEHGYKQLKIYNSFKPEWVTPTVARAHQRGLKVGGHVPAFMRAADVVGAGFDELHHVNQVMLNFFVKPKDDTRTLLRFYLVGDNAHRLDLDGKEARSFISELARRSVVVDPTLATFEGSYRQRQGQLNPAYADIVDHLPPGMVRGLRQNSMDLNSRNAQRFGASYEKMLGLIGRLHKAGVPLVAGTDDFPGLMLHRELALYVKAGIPAAEALRIATWGSAKVAGLSDEVGKIDVGQRADLILVNGDPTRDITALRRIQLVIRDGSLIDPAPIWRAHGILPFAALPTGLRP